MGEYSLAKPAFKLTQRWRVRTQIVQILSLLTVAALLGCQAQPSTKTSTKASTESQARAPLPLPTEFSQSYQMAFQENPSLTAQRFLHAYDGFTQHSPVTRKTVQDHAKVHASLERGQILGGILATELNADGLITRFEFETLPAFPNGNKKPDRFAGIFEFDENKDDLMTFEDALRFGQELNALHSENNQHPIESYLMLFDLDADGEVMRDEVMMALHIHLPKPERARGG